MILGCSFVQFYGISFNLYSLRFWRGFWELLYIPPVFMTYALTPPGCLNWMGGLGLRDRGSTPALRQTGVHPLLKKPYLDPGELNNYCLVSDLPILSKVIQQVVAGQLLRLLNDVDCVDLFQFGFKPSYGTELALVSLADDIFQEMDPVNSSEPLGGF